MDVVEGVGILLTVLGTLAATLALISLVFPLKVFRIPTRKRALVVLLVGAVMSIAGSGMTAAPRTVEASGGTPKPESPVATRANAEPAARAVPAPSVAQTPPAPVMPADQAKFVAAAVEAQAEYRGAANEMAAGGMRALRRQKICAAVKSPQVRDWVGTISTLSSANDGKGVLEVTLAKDVSVATWNNTFSDMETKTLIEPGSPVFNQAVQLKRGDKVVFSGTFFPSKDDCWAEKSVSLRGSMTAPSYTFRFSAIRKL